MEWRKRPEFLTTKDLFFGSALLGYVWSDYSGKWCAQYSNGTSDYSEHDSEESAKIAVEKWAAAQLATIQAPTPAEPPNCGNCRFGLDTKDGSSRPVKCRKSHPTVIQDGDTEWSRVAPSEWCGEHEPRRP